MTSNPVCVALESIGAAIRRLHQPMGRNSVTDELGTSWSHAYRVEGEARERVEEALIGAAFALTQTYIVAAKRKRTPETANVITLANYWKHRDEWGKRWTRKRKNRATIRAIYKLGGRPPATLGQLTHLAEAAFGAPFTVDQLTALIR